MSAVAWQSALFFSRSPSPNQRKVVHVVRRAIECLCTHLVQTVHKGSIALRTTWTTFRWLGVVVWQPISPVSWSKIPTYPPCYMSVVAWLLTITVSGSSTPNYPSCYMSVVAWQSALFFSRSTLLNQRKVVHVVRRDTVFVYSLGANST